jgi:hypothetical protein
VADPKPFASLSSGLLARKGAARPAMRPQGFGQGGSSLEDLGWNDMGFEPPKPAETPRDAGHDAFGEDVVSHPRAHPTGLTPIQSPVHHQQAEIADRLGGDETDAGEEEYDDTAEIFEPEVDQPAPAQEPLQEAEQESEPEPEPELEPEPEPEPEPEVAPAILQPVAPVAAVPRRASSRARTAPGIKAKAAFTLRLDRDRHLKLRLACAVDGRSAQQLVTDALDQLLDRMPELDAMAAKAARKG